MAKELDVVIFVNMKLSRHIEEREDYYPKPYDFSLPAEAMDGRLHRISIRSVREEEILSGIVLSVKMKQNNIWSSSGTT